MTLAQLTSKRWSIQYTHRRSLYPLLYYGETKPNCDDYIFTFGITLIFPVFASVVESVHTDSQSRFLNKNIYIPFIYLVWNLGDLLGRVLCGYPRLNMLIKSPKTQLVYALSRLVFIPCFDM